MLLQIRLTRLKNLLKYGWRHARQISKETGRKKIPVFLDIVNCYRKYGMFSNYYYSLKFWELSDDERNEVGLKHLQETIKRDEWINDFYDNQKFLEKYSGIEYDAYGLNLERQQAYIERYKTGEDLFVESNVKLSRQHWLDGEIKIGKDVLLAKNVFIDYSGGVTIQDKVTLSNGVIIESHSHPGWIMSGITAQKDVLIQKHRDIAEKTPLLIEEGATIGSNSIILETCNVIGRSARIGAGTVIRNSVPRYSIVVGNPAKIVGFFYTPKQMKKFEEQRFQENERTDYDEYCQIYAKYTKGYRKNVKEYLKIWLTDEN